jgi:hypothetical protein
MQLKDLKTKGLTFNVIKSRLNRKYRDVTQMWQILLASEQLLGVETAIITYSTETTTDDNNENEFEENSHHEQQHNKRKYHDLLIKVSHFPSHLVLFLY